MTASLQFTATAGLAEREADLAVSWSADAAAPRGLQLVRRRQGYSADRQDGETIFDLAAMYPDGAAPPWAVADVWRYRLDNRQSENEDLAEIVEYRGALASVQPSRVTLRARGDGGALQTWRFDSVSRVTRDEAATPQFGRVTTVKIFVQPGGAPETLAGQAVISTQSTAAGPVTTLTDFSSGERAVKLTSAPPPNLFVWTPVAGPGVTLAFARETQRSLFAVAQSPAGTSVSFLACDAPGGRGALPLAVTAAGQGRPIVVTTEHDHKLETGAHVSIVGASGNTAANGTWAIEKIGPNQFALVGSTGNGVYAGAGVVYPALLNSADFVETANTLTQQVDRTLRLIDRTPAGEAPATAFYYTAYLDAADVAAASARTTSGASFGDKLFQLLPAVHRYYDDPQSGLNGAWQLRRFLAVFGPALDHARALSEALPSLTDPLAAPADYLPLLGRAIGWEIDRTLSTQRQRTDLAFAPRVYETLGARPNLQALATRATGWRCEVKEFVNNVFLTNAVEPVRLKQIFESAKPDPAAAFAAPALQADLYPEATEPGASQADPAGIDARPAAALDAGGKLWLFWHSTRLGSEWRPGASYAVQPFASRLAPQSARGLVYECVRAGVSGAVAPDFPATVGATVDDGGARWIRRGPAARRRRLWLLRPGVDATPVQALADLDDAAEAFDEAPAVAAVAGGLVLAWASNRNGRSEIWLRAFSGAGMAPGPAQPLTRAHADDRAPALAVGGATLFAFWESQQPGGRRILFASSADAGATWSALAPVSPGPQDRTPAAGVDAAGQMHVFWSAAAGGGSHIRQAAASGAGWTVADVTGAEYAIYDAAPAAVLWKGAIRLFWRSNRLAAAWTPATPYKLNDIVAAPQRNGAWYVCVKAGASGAAAPAFPMVAGATVADGGAAWLCRGLMADAPFARTTRLWSAAGPAFSAPAAIFVRAANDGDPAPVVDGAGALRLLFSSQATGARYRSRTFDADLASPDLRLKTANLLAKASMHGVQDRLHYTYDTRRTSDACFARDAVGLYLFPAADGQSDAQHRQAADRLRSSLTPFRPISTRLVYFLQLSGTTGFTPVGADP